MVNLTDVPTVRFATLKSGETFVDPRNPFRGSQIERWRKMRPFKGTLGGKLNAVSVLDNSFKPFDDIDVVSCP